MAGNALNNLNREKSSLTSEKARPSSFTGRPMRRSPITGDVDKFPVTQGMYRGETFAAPTFGAPGVIFPWEILEKRRAAKVEAEKEVEAESLAIDHEIQEVKDEISNAIFIGNQNQRFNDILADYTEEFGGDRKKAIYYLNIENPNILKNEALRWKNFRSLFDKTWDNYVNVITDTDAFGLSKYDDESKGMADIFANFIANPDMLKPEAIEQYNVFMTAFNERMSYIEIAKEGAAQLKGMVEEKIKEFAGRNKYNVVAIEKKLSENFDDLAEDYLQMFGGLRDLDEEQKKSFMNVFKNFFIKSTIESISFPGENFTLSDRIVLEQFKMEEEARLAAAKIIEIPDRGRTDINITNEEGVLIGKAPIDDYHDISSDPVKFTGKVISKAYNTTKGKYEDIPGGLTGEIVGIGKLEKSEMDILVPIEETEKQRKNREKKGEPVPTKVLNTLKVRDSLNRVGYVRVEKEEKYKGKWFEYYIVDYISVANDIVRGKREDEYKFEKFDISEKGKKEEVNEEKVIKATKEQMEAAAKVANVTSEEVIKYWEGKGYKVEIISKVD